MTMSASPAVP